MHCSNKYSAVDCEALKKKKNKTANVPETKQQKSKTLCDLFSLFQGVLLQC